MNELKMKGTRGVRKNGNHIKMISLKEISLFVVIILSCSLHANGKSVKSSIAIDSVNEVNDNQSEVLNRKTELRKIRKASDNEHNYDDGYVMEDMNLVQQDQPSFLRQPAHYGQMQKDFSPQDIFETKKRGVNSQQQNWQLTKEVLIKQGRLKGVVRPMYPYTGLRNVRQYLGIPYAAAPIGNGRFMPPGLFIICIVTNSHSKQFNFKSKKCVSTTEKET